MKIFLLLVLLSPSLSKKIPDEVRKTWNEITAPHLSYCLKHSNISADEAESMLESAHIPNKERFHNYLQCIYEKSGMLQPDGNFNLNVIYSKSKPIKQEALLKKCVEKTENEKHLAKKSYLLCICIVDGLAED
ncbi:hypothetical protein FQR65_LT01668 [Abscondita terminalis]|nr:hypothetical protein FQR65_LT01668 [Abscondita terminalis]